MTKTLFFLSLLSSTAWAQYDSWSPHQNSNPNEREKPTEYSQNYAQNPAYTQPYSYAENPNYQPQNTFYNASLLAEDLKQYLTQKRPHLALQTAKNLSISAVSEEDKSWAIYGEALAYFIAEDYVKSLEVLERIIQAPYAYFNAARQLRDDLRLYLASVAMVQNQPDLANHYLSRVERPFAASQQQILRQLQSKLQDNPYQNAPFLKVGVLLPLSGLQASLGQGILNAMQLAVFESPESRIVLYPQDTSNTPEGALNAVQNLRNGQIDAIVGPLLSTQTETISADLQHRNIPVLALTSDAALAKHNVYPFGYRPDTQARIAVKAAIQASKTHIAALVPSSPYGYATLDALETEAKAHNLSVQPVAFFNPENADLGSALDDLLQLQVAKQELRAEIKALEASKTALGDLFPEEEAGRLEYLKTTRKPPAVLDFDTLFLPVDAAKLQLISAQLALYDVDQQDVLFLGTALWDSPQLAKGAPYIPYGLFAGIERDSQVFGQYEATYGSSMPRLAQLGYSAVRVLAQAGHIQALEGGSLSQALKTPYGFNTPDGGIAFLENGQTQRNYALKKLNRRRIVHVKHAAPLIPPSLPNPLKPTEKPSFERFVPWKWGN